MTYGKRLQKFWDSLPEDEKEEIKQELLKENLAKLSEENAKLKEENRILDLMTKTSDEATDIINKQELHRLMLEFYDMFYMYFSKEDSFRIDRFCDSVGFTDSLDIVVQTRSDDIAACLEKRIKLAEGLYKKQEEIAPKSRHIFLSVEYIE